jgi:uncharacterized protein YidB (DUF937 family)/outer membrane protein OmpA-like peptidoglycan-associated protein
LSVETKSHRFSAEQKIPKRSEKAMTIFDSILGEAGKKFGVGDKAGNLLSVLLALLTDRNRGGLTGFLDQFKRVGLGDTASSWVTAGNNAPLSDEQLESALGAETIDDIAAQTGVDSKTATSALAFMTPKIVDTLTPDGVIPDESTLLSKIGGFLTGLGGAAVGGVGTAGATASDTVDRIGTAASGAFNKGKDTLGAVGDRVSTNAERFDDAIDGDSGNSVLRWLLPLLLLGLLIALGYWLCGRPSSAPTTVTNANVNANANRAANSNLNANAARTIDSSFSIKADNGKYTVTGVVPDEATKKQIVDALTAQYGAGNVDFTGLRVDASAKPFAARWWDNFAKMLPNLKEWKTGTLAVAGNAVTTASGLPQAALDQIKSLFAGWTLPASLSGGGATETDRKLTEVSLPNGTKLQAYPGGIEDQLLKFIQSDEYKNGTAATLKDKWFNFDDLNFKFGTTELVPESKRQLDNIVAILKAFPDVKIKIGGYTDKKGDDAANKPLSGDRAKAVKTALEKAGVGAQVPEAEGYGEEFATVAETASDEERKADRKTSVRLLK